MCRLCILVHTCVYLCTLVHSCPQLCTFVHKHMCMIYMFVHNSAHMCAHLCTTGGQAGQFCAHMCIYFVWRVSGYQPQRSLRPRDDKYIRSHSAQVFIIEFQCQRLQFRIAHHGRSGFGEERAVVVVRRRAIAVKRLSATPSCPATGE